jgi:ABC-type cobalt transport system substrate-binding protein
MKRVVIVTAILALMACPVQAQMGGGGRRHQGGADKTSEQKKTKVDDKAYKAALEKIPEPKTKYDPWGIARPAESDKKPK